MKRRSLCLSMLMFCLLTFARIDYAQEIQLSEPAWLKKMSDKGWHKVQEGVLQRDAGKGRIETFGYGAEGYQWLIESYRQQVTYFERKYRKSPTAELASLIDRLQDKINTLQNEALAAPAVKFFDGRLVEGCEISFEYMADAGPLTSTQGVTAVASAHFHNTCSLIGSTLAYAYAQASDMDALNTLTQVDPEVNGTWIDSYATASIAGSMECESKAKASVDIPSLNIVRLIEDENHDCPDWIWITGPSQAQSDYYGPACASVTWTAHTASGRNDYAFHWYIGADPQPETGPILSRRYCSEDTNVTVRAVVHDSDERSYESPPFATQIRYRDRIIVSVDGPSTVNTDYYSSPCATVTWTARASGNHSALTYNWYLGDGTTSQGTGSTFSKQYCNTSQTVNVKAVATAPDGHSGSGATTTNIVNQPQLTALISGPATFTIDYYDTQWPIVSWTASAAGGRPGYTYNWYRDTSSTLLWTGSTFPLPNSDRNVSLPLTLRLRVVVTDSEGHAATSPIFATEFRRGPAIVAQISGPAAVSTNSSVPCTNVTWTASTSGAGHYGYSYKWYLGTSTVQSTSSTFTKRYCRTTATLTVKLVATASDGHSDDAAFITTLTHVN